MHCSCKASKAGLLTVQQVDKLCRCSLFKLQYCSIQDEWTIIAINVGHMDTEWINKTCKACMAIHKQSQLAALRVIFAL